MEKLVKHACEPITPREISIKDLRQMDSGQRKLAMKMTELGLAKLCSSPIDTLAVIELAEVAPFSEEE